MCVTSRLPEKQRVGRLTLFCVSFAVSVLTCTCSAAQLSRICRAVYSLRRRLFLHSQNPATFLHALSVVGRAVIPLDAPLLSNCSVLVQLRPGAAVLPDLYAGACLLTPCPRVVYKNSPAPSTLPEKPGEFLFSKRYSQGLIPILLMPKNVPFGNRTTTGDNGRIRVRCPVSFADCTPTFCSAHHTRHERECYREVRQSTVTLCHSI